MTKQTQTLETTPPAAAAGGRFAAGEDPAKREQIIAGAKRVFMTVGFDAASMNDITREAGVSKGTIYVYFASKEDLFVAMVDRERDRIASDMRDILAGSGPVEEMLSTFGVSFARHITSPQVVDAMRTVIGVVQRMPNLSRRFFHTTPGNVRHVLEEFLRRHIALGTLVIDDTDLAARQFIEMATGSFFKFRLFGDLDDVPCDAELERAISGAVRVFMAAYGAKD
ncbi:MAG: TetR/AcrR family transcriptional regulator [Pseudorhizobium pelagicum]|uniref:TetR/AcrR family transcriptional regulator n=1 Tax=Pseudorhizobium pelagicum TaxID=1509405 RepID=UPI003460B81B